MYVSFFQIEIDCYENEASFGLSLVSRKHVVECRPALNMYILLNKDIYTASD